MTQEEQVLIRGKVFLYRQKAPFVPSGESIHGALEYSERSDEVRCHECGGWFRFLSTHVFRTHGLRACEYRNKHGLRRKCALCGPRMSIKMRAGKEEYYQSLRERKRSPGGRAEFGAIARATASERQPRTDVIERLNETGHCRAQLTQRLKQLHDRYGEIPTTAELIRQGISPGSVCLAFNLPTLTEVLKSLELTQSATSRGYTREALIEVLRDFWVKYGRLPGRTHERMGLVPKWDAFKRAFGSIVAAYDEAGLASAMVRGPHRDEALRETLIRRIQDFYQQYGDVPKPKSSRRNGHGSDDALPPGFPTVKAVRRIFGSLSGAYRAAGFVRVQKAGRGGPAIWTLMEQRSSAAD